MFLFNAAAAAAAKQTTTANRHARTVATADPTII